MSFFGFDTTLPRDRAHPSSAPGFGQAPDPFANISRARGADEEEDVLDFDETYDGLADQLDETDDVLNDDTFGGDSSSAQKSVGKDYDFFGQTAKVAGAINEEQMRFGRQQIPQKSVSTLAASPPKPAAQPAKTGYERYKEPGYIPDLQANASLWGVAPKRPTAAVDMSHQRQPSQTAVPSQTKRMMSLEEVEAAMRAQAKKTSPVQASQQQQQAFLPPGPPSYGQPQFQQPVQIPQPPPQYPVQHHMRSGSGLAQVQPQVSRHGQQSPSQYPVQGHTQAPQILKRPQAAPASTSQTEMPQPRQILQNPNRLSAQMQPPVPDRPKALQTEVQPTSSGGQAVITHPEQLLNLSEEERAAFLLEDAKRAKRNHKIHLLSKDNGLMTPQDKNFITRIQLQQLVTATGNPNEVGTEAALAEDFYYQVLSQIRGVPRQTPHQPLGHFAQTYLLQTGNRQGGMRRHNRGADNHLQRMEQQVQRAVEAAKLKPKNKQLVIEGSLGKISFSNAKTPKPLLNIKRTESERKPHPTVTGDDRKTILRYIENVYRTLMELEDHERRMPPIPSDDSDAAAIEKHVNWRQEMQNLNQKLWSELKVMEPIVPNSPVAHPFIAILSFGKGKKAIPRVWRHIDQEQRLTILTIIAVHLDVLDVVRLAQKQPPPANVREEVELFSLTVMPSLFSYVNEAPLHLITGLLGLLLDRVNVQAVAGTKVGLGFLTMILSRAELVRQAGGPSEVEWDNWTKLYNRLFDTLEPVLPVIFPIPVTSAEDVYVWQFLAALGVGASPDQQQRLVLGVKDRVMETVTLSKTLPPEMSAQRLANVNLFMRAIGLDVELLG